ncbi:MAG: septum site-determining protein MinC [bacterium]
MLQLKHEKGKIIIKIEQLEEISRLKQKLQEYVDKGLKDIVENNLVILDLGDIGLNETDFKNLIQMFNSYDIPIDMIRNTNPITKMLALSYSIPIDAPSIINTQNKLTPRTQIPPNPTCTQPQNKPQTTYPTFTNLTEKNNNQDSKDNDIVIFRKNVRGGSVLESQKSILLIGNVNPGAEIRSSKNIIILGKLMGTAHAGYPNNPSCFIFTLKLKNPLIKIANMIAEFDESEIKKRIKTTEISNILFYPENNSIRMEIIKDQKE